MNLQSFRLPARISPALLCGVALLLLVFYLLEGMSSPLNHDEDHYLGGAVMAMDHVIYQDYTYSAMPLHPVLMGAFLRAFSTAEPFWWFRLMSAVLVWLSAVFLFLAIRRLSGHDTVALLLASFYALNSLVIYSTNGLISCHIPALALAMGGALALHLSLTRGSMGWAVTCGALLCAAAGFKLFYFLLLPLVLGLFWFFRYSPDTRVRVRLCAGYCIGTLITGAPVLFIFFQDPYAFLFNNFIFHQYNTEWHIASGQLGRISLLSRVAYVFEKLGYTGNGAVALTLLVMGFSLRWRGLRAQLFRRDSMSMVWLVLAVAATVGCMMPRPMHLHYLTFPLPFYILLAAALYPAMAQGAQRRLQAVLCVCAIIVTVAGGRYLFQHGVSGLSPAQWVPNVAHREALKIVASLDGYPEPKRVATLSPLLVIEAGLPFYEVWSSGPFFFRIGDVVPLEVQEDLGMVQKGHALEYLEKHRPAAVLLGFADSHEAEFREFVERAGYVAWPEAIYERGTLYLRPATALAPLQDETVSLTSP